jgi:hypothetical protein
VAHRSQRAKVFEAARIWVWKLAKWVLSFAIGPEWRQGRESASRELQSWQALGELPFGSFSTSKTCDAAEGRGGGLEI